MRIARVNGSPKGGKSNSGILLEKLAPLLEDGGCELPLYRVGPKPFGEEQYRELYTADALVLAFPLYFDGIPSHFLRMMVGMEAWVKRQGTPPAEAPGSRPLPVYVLVNNGFYEGGQCRTAVSIVRNWCGRCGFRFGMAVGFGAGEMLGSLEKVPLGRGPLKDLGQALEALASAVRTGAAGESVYLSPNFPRVAWRLAATYGFWHPQAKKNGLKVKDLKRRPEPLQEGESFFPNSKNPAALQSGRDDSSRMNG
ncbi:flavodoxin family protein [Paenibacillus spiritus]|uniref:flavodoxin family protein n=1 Tax=Paenibacillus spiritus TaxID=2496557 RepID=UPI00168B9DD1|nr:flavodoxin family protein [Paenibacillus spiritus]